MKRLISALMIFALVLSVGITSVCAGVSGLIIAEEGADRDSLSTCAYGYLGDVDISDAVTVKDATVIQKYVANLLDLRDANAVLADTDLSGKVNVRDATTVQKWAANIEITAPVNRLIATDDESVTHFHAYKMSTTASTCSENGKVTYTCQCGESYETALGLSDKHNWNVGDSFIYQKDGKYFEFQYRYCDDCDKGEEIEIETTKLKYDIQDTANVVLTIADGFDIEKGDNLFYTESSQFKVFIELYFSDKATSLGYDMYSVKVADLDAYTLKYFNTKVDWANSHYTYDKKTDSVKFKKPMGVGYSSAIATIASMTETSKGVYTLELSDYGEHYATLVLEQTKYGFAPVTLTYI